MLLTTQLKMEHYFKPVINLLSPRSELAKVVPPKSIKEANSFRGIIKGQWSEKAGLSESFHQDKNKNS